MQYSSMHSHRDDGNEKINTLIFFLAGDKAKVVESFNSILFINMILFIM